MGTKAKPEELISDEIETDREAFLRDLRKVAKKDAASIKRDAQSSSKKRET